jgi:dolichol-phosphate mannosyltransferase
MVIYFVLPAYNEEKDLPRFFDEFISIKFPFSYRIIVVNDGSGDSTAAIISDYGGKLPIEVITHPTNLGLGKALSSGFAALEGKLGDLEFAVTMDSDGTHPLEAVYDIKRSIEAGSDVVVASRFVAEGTEQGVNFLRRGLSHAASSGLRILWPIKNIRDYSSGYRGYSANIIRKLRNKYHERTFEENGFASTLEVLLKASMLTDKFAEVPLRLRYDSKQGESKMKIVPTIKNYFKLITRLRLAK